MSSAITAWAWPTASVLIVLILRRPLTHLLTGRPLRRLKVGPSGVEAEWQGQAAVVAASVALPPGMVDPESTLPRRSSHTFGDEMRELAQRASPLAAVVACENRIGTELRARLDAFAVPGEDLSSLSNAELALVASERGLVSAATATAVEGLGVMHRMALIGAGEGFGLDQDNVRDYIAWTEGVLFAISVPPRP